MRIIGGSARGTKLYSLDGNNTRPTLDRVKESLFNIIQFEIPGCVFLDLFAGSGAIGLEAISRGAKKAILIDKSKEAMQIIKKNIIKTHFEKEVEVYLDSYENVLQNKLKQKVDIIYIDPPYDSQMAYEALKLIMEKDILYEDSMIIIETDNQEKIIKEIEPLNIEITNTRKYGRAHLIFLAKKDVGQGKG